MKVIFLDNDGVLKGYGYGTGVFMRIMMKTDLVKSGTDMLLL